MDRSRRANDLLHRIALEYAYGPSTEAPRTPPSGEQAIPVNVYDTGEDIVIVAPMPGVEADNIDVEILGTEVRLRASMRGPGQEDRTYLVHEWTYGPYSRTVTLPIEVDAQHANASHGNGVLVLSLPKAPQARAVRVPLHQAGADESRHHGHSGHHTTREGLEHDSTGEA